MYKLTEKGREVVYNYMLELKAKRKEILDAGKDSADETHLPTYEDFEDDIDFIGIDWDYPDGPCYFNGWSVTDNYESDYPICLKLGEDFVDTDYIPDQNGTVIETYRKGTFFKMIPETIVMDDMFGRLWKVVSNKPTIELREVTKAKVPGLNLSFSNVSSLPFGFTLKAKKSLAA